MDLTIKSLGELFRPDLQLEIPAFRSRSRSGYWWGGKEAPRPGQWPDCRDGEFWATIAELASKLADVLPQDEKLDPENLSEARASGLQAADTSYGRSAFLGIIAVSDLLRWAGTNDLQRRIVIGDELLVLKLQLVLSATYATATLMGAADETHRLKRLLFNDAPPSEPMGRFKVLPSTLYGPEFSGLIEDSSLALDQYSDKPIVRDWQYYLTKIEEWVCRESGTPAATLSRLISLSVTLRETLMVGLLELDSGDNAQQISAALGEHVFPFSASDQVKNQLLAGDDGRGTDAVVLHAHHLSFLDKDYWSNTYAFKQYPNISREDTFLYYWLQMELEDDLPVDAAWSGFVKLYGRGTRPAQALLSSIQHHAPIFKRLAASRTRHPGGRPDRQALYRLHLTTGPGVLPLLMWLYGTYAPGKRNEPDGALLGALQTLESFAVRNMICGASHADLSEHFRALLTALKANSAVNEGSVLGHLEALLMGALQGGKLKWPSDEQVKSGATSTQLYGSGTRWPVRMVLESIEEWTHDSPDEQHLLSQVQLERLMPTKWKDSAWPTLPQDASFAELEAEVAPGAELSPSELRDRCVSLLGNFTLVTQLPSKTERNGSWNKKRQALGRQLPLRLNDGLSERDKWDEYDIVERSLKLAEMVCEIWPRPEKS